MANVSPGVYTKVKDLSTYIQSIPGTIGFLCALTEKGEDNKVKFLSGRDELVNKFGEPNISLYGVDYSQGSYIAYNYLGESGAFYFMRCLPNDATYSNLRIDGLDYDSSTDIEISYVSDINNNTTDITTALETVGIRNPLVIFYPIGRGQYYNCLGIELESDPEEEVGVYILNIYERQSDGLDVVTESYKISFDSDAKNNTGESIFVEYVLEQYSQVLRSKVGSNGFNLLERVFDNEQSPVYVTYEDTYSTSDATSIIDTTCIIDSTMVVEIECPEEGPISGSWSTTTVLNNARYNNGGFGDVNDAITIGGIEAETSVEKWGSDVWTTTTSHGQQHWKMGACGNTSDGFTTGGNTGSRTTRVRKWDGSLWTNTTSLNSATETHGTCGVTSAILSFGGTTDKDFPQATRGTEIWNGASWATTSQLTEMRQMTSGCGTTSAALCNGGTSYGSRDAHVEIWNGSTWATTTFLNYISRDLTSFGTTENAIACGGHNGTDYSRKTEVWNGGIWTTTSNLNQKRQRLNSTDIGAFSALTFGGDTGSDSVLTVTEKWIASYATSQRIEHYDEIVPCQVVEHYTVTTGEVIAQITNDGQDFSQWETDPNNSPLSQYPYTVIAKDPWHNRLWGYIGLSDGSTDQKASVYLDKLLTTTGWNGIFDDLDQSDPNNVTYVIKKSNEDLTSLFSPQPLKKGSEGSLIVKGTFDTSVANQILAQGYAGVIDADVLDTEKIYYNLIYDAGYSKNVKDQIVGLAQSREDCVAIVDNSDNATFNDAIYDRQNNYVYNTYFASLFDSNSRIYDIFTSRQVWFSPCYHMAYILPRNDRVAELWYASAGNNRGVARDIQELRYSLTHNQRDQFYINQINPIIKFNTSYMLYSQLTTQSKPSALQDLNIVRLLLYLKKALDQYANTFIFNQNTQVTWNQVQSEVVNFLEQVKKKRGIFNYNVTVGATDLERKNKTFHINVMFNPVKTTEKIELNFYIK